MYDVALNSTRPLLCTYCTLQYVVRSARLTVQYQLED